MGEKIRRGAKARGGNQLDLFVGTAGADGDREGFAVTISMMPFA